MALAEITVQDVGMRAMTAVLLKRVLLTILRRSRKSAELWTERFPILSDPKIARALVSMLADPSAAHSVQSLSHTAGLSRSAFMAHFTHTIGISPFAALKRLRMREAARLLTANALTVECIANLVGYASRTSFSRAFRSIYGTDPFDYRSDNGAHAIVEGGMKKESDDHAGVKNGFKSHCHK
jgi:AraC family transcriptional activator of mtrCDE